MSKLIHLVLMAAFATSAAAEPAAHPELELAIERHFPTEPRPNLQPEPHPGAPAPRLRSPARSKVSVAVRANREPIASGTFIKHS